MLHGPAQNAGRAQRLLRSSARRTYSSVGNRRPCSTEATVCTEYRTCSASSSCVGPARLRKPSTTAPNVFRLSETSGSPPPDGAGVLRGTRPAYRLLASRDPSGVRR